MKFIKRPTSRVLILFLHIVVLFALIEVSSPLGSAGLLEDLGTTLQTETGDLPGAQVLLPNWLHRLPTFQGSIDLNSFSQNLQRCFAQSEPNDIVECVDFMFRFFSMYAKVKVEAPLSISVSPHDRFLMPASILSYKLADQGANLTRKAQERGYVSDIKDKYDTGFVNSVSDENNIRIPWLLSQIESDPSSSFLTSRESFFEKLIDLELNGKQVPNNFSVLALGSRKSDILARSQKGRNGIEKLRSLFKKDFLDGLIAYANHGFVATGQEVNQCMELLQGQNWNLDQLEKFIGLRLRIRKSLQSKIADPFRASLEIDISLSKFGYNLKEPNKQKELESAIPMLLDREISILSSLENKIWMGSANLKNLESIIPKFSNLFKLLKEINSDEEFTAFLNFYEKMKLSNAEQVLAVEGQIPIQAIYYVFNKIKPRTNPEGFLNELQDFVRHYPAALQSDVNRLQLQWMEGQEEKLLDHLKIGLSSKNLERLHVQRTVIQQKLKQWIANLPKKDDIEQAVRLAQLVQDTSDKDKLGLLTEAIATYDSPFLDGYLTHFGISNDILSHLNFAREKGFLENGTMNSDGAKKFINDFQLEKIYEPHIQLKNQDANNSNRIRELILTKIIPNEDLNPRYLAYIKAGHDLTEDVLELTRDFPKRIAHYFLQSAANARPGEESKALAKSLKIIRSHASQRDIRFDFLPAEQDLSTLLGILEKDPVLLNQLEEKVYESASPLLPGRKFYRWGKRDYEKKRIGASAFNLAKDNYALMLSGQGLYVASGPLQSITFGDGTAPYVTEIEFPADTRIIGNEELNALWKNFNENAENQVLIEKLGVKSLGDLNQAINFLNMKSLLLSIGGDNKWFVYKTSKHGKSEVVRKPRPGFLALEDNPTDVSNQKISGNSAVHAFKRSMPATEFPCETSDSEIWKYQFGNLFRVVEAAGNSINEPKTAQDKIFHVLEVRDSIRDDHRFNCLDNNGSASITDARSLTMFVHDVPAKSCADLNESWKDGFVCYPIGDKFIWVGLKNPDYVQYAFKSENECLSAGKIQKDSFRCLPVQGSTPTSKFTIVNGKYSSVLPEESAFVNLQSCQQSLHTLDFSRICIPTEGRFELVNLFDGTKSSAANPMPTLDDCKSILSSERKAVFDKIKDEAKSARDQSEEGQLIYSQFTQIPYLKFLMDQNNSDSSTLGEHSQAVLSNWDKFWDATLKHPEKESTMSLNRIADLVEMKVNDFVHLFRVVVLLHDIGKPNDSIDQHQETIKIVKPILNELGYSKRQIEVALALVDQDLLGEALREGSEGSEKRMTPGIIKSLKYRIQALAANIGVHAYDFMNLMIPFYSADASYYPAIAKEVFVTDPANGTMKIADPGIEKIRQSLKQGK